MQGVELLLPGGVGCVRDRGACMQGVELLLPVDVVCTRDLDSDRACCTNPLNARCCTEAAPCVPDDAFGADLGPASRALFAAALARCRTVLWNGPMGRYEQPAFAAATAAVARAVAAATAAGATTIIGGARPCSHRLHACMRGCARCHRRHRHRRCAPL